MRSGNSVRWQKTIFAVGVILLFIAFVVWLVVQVLRGDLERSDKLASVVSMSIAVASLPVTIVTLIAIGRRDPRTDPASNPASRLDMIADTLATSVSAQWEAEEQIRRIHDPFPLETRWTNADEAITDYWQNIHGSPDKCEPIPLTGRGNQIAEIFALVPSGRLVMLGRAGAGKTILASRFALTMLAGRAPVSGSPVPMIFSLGSWDPTTSSLRGWLCDQLTTSYPSLAERHGESTVAHHLLTTRRIMPVLDGFDEITETLRVHAIEGINAGLRPGDQLMLTSRPDEYAAAVNAGDVLTAGAVIEIADLTVTDLARYLPLTTHKSGSGTTRTKWHPVLDHLSSSSSSTDLAAVLSTPLMVALARTIFSDTNADPAELVDVRSSNNHERRRVLEDRLLAGFIPAVYSNTAHHEGPANGRSFRGDEARRWLSFLAAHLQRLGTYDLAWWQLVLAVPRRLVGFIAGFVITMVGWAGSGFGVSAGTWPGGSHTAVLSASLIFSLIAGMFGGTTIGLGRGIRPSPSRMRLRVRGRVPQIARDLTGRLHSRAALAFFAAWTGGGLTFGVASLFLLESSDGLVVGLAAGLFCGFFGWLVATLVGLLGSPVEPTETVSPMELLRTDRTTALRQAPLGGAGCSSVMWLAIWAAFDPVFGVPFGDVLGRGVWLVCWFLSSVGAALIWMLFVTVWGPWLIARTWLPLTHHLPWRTMTFLADAHKRGVLRQAGGVYQFRHARLQEFLAAGYERPTPAVTPPLRGRALPSGSGVAGGSC